MSKVTYKCVDCGKERTAYKSAFKYIIKENYRCKRCAAKKKFENVLSKKITYKCVDCSKERTTYIYNFTKSPEEYRCKKCAAINLMKDPEMREMRKQVAQKTSKNPDWLESVRLSGLKRRGNLKYIESMKAGAKKRSSDPIYIEHLTLAIRKKFEDPIYREKMTNAALKKAHDPIWLEKCRKVLEKTKISLRYIENQLISRYGEGIWYGNKYLHREYSYCELWNKNLWVRIDAAYNYKSILSGKDKFDNNGRNLTHHHVYWQPKACCVWDEDAQGYYAWIINNGEKIKYYIKGDPNKFVLLTDKEHGIIKGKNGTPKDRIYYIKLMEDLIEQRMKEGKKCYLTPEEYEVYKIEHADIIEKYKK